MNKYNVFLTLKWHKKYYVTICLEYEIPFHPNYKDEIMIGGNDCKVEAIRYKLDFLYYGIDLVLCTTEDPNMLDTESDEDIMRFYQNEYNYLKAWCKQHGDTIRLHDCILPNGMHIVE